RSAQKDEGRTIIPRKGGTVMRVGRMPWWMAGLLAVGIGLSAAARAWADQIVYDNTSHPLGVGFLAHEGEQWGNTLILADSAHVVTAFEVLLSPGLGGRDLTVDATLRFYLPDGSSFLSPDGPVRAPGTLFYSQRVSNVFVPATGQRPLVFTVPEVIVPNSF